MGRRAARGLGMARNPTVAIEWLSKAAEAHFNESMEEAYGGQDYYDEWVGARGRFYLAGVHAGLAQDALETVLRLSREYRRQPGMMPPELRTYLSNLELETAPRLAVASKLADGIRDFR